MMNPGDLLIVKPTGIDWYWKGFRTEAPSGPERQAFENIFIHSGTTLIFLGKNKSSNSSTIFYQFYFVSQGMAVTLPTRMGDKLFNGYRLLNI